MNLPRTCPPRRSEQGMATIMFIGLLAIMVILVAAESRSLEHLHRDDPAAESGGIVRSACSHAPLVAQPESAAQPRRAHALARADRVKRRASADTRVRQARVELAVAESALVKSVQPWWRRLQQHRSALALASGFAAGLALALFPSRWWARAGAAAGATAATAARSALMPVVIGAVLSQIRLGKGAAHPSEPSSHSE